MSDRKTWIARWRAALQDQHHTYFDEGGQQLKTEYAEFTDCPSCGSDSSDFNFEKDGFRYHKCTECALIFMNPRLNDAATQQFYNSDVNEIYNETKFHDPGLTRGDDERNAFNLELTARHRPPPGKLLEIGCAKGFFLSRAQERGYEVYGVELNRSLCELARQAVGPTVENADLFAVAYPSAYFDVLYMRDLIEHIPNPAPFFRELNRIAKPSGILVLETHNIEGLVHRIVGKKHTVIFGFEHPVHWSPPSIRAALERSGFALEEIVFVSPDFTIRDLLVYGGPATFTTIFPQPVGWTRRQLVRAASRTLSLPGLRWLDSRVTAKIADWSGRGSVMKVVARKIGDAPAPNGGGAK